MSRRDVIVLGAGAAGTAAAWHLARSGCHVRVVHAAAGATALWNGIVDGLPGTPSPAESELLSLLGICAPRSPAKLLNIFGLFREADAHDEALLDLARARPALVLVPTLPRAAWDGEALAAGLRAHAGSGFDAQTIAIPDLLLPGELAWPDGAIACALDDDGRRAAFESSLTEKLAPWKNTATALLLPPWLGVSKPYAKPLEKALGVGVGEVASGLAAAAGLRFVHRRDALFAHVGVEVHRSRCEAIDRDGESVRLTLKSGELVTGTHLLVAFGGFVSGALQVPRHPAISLVPAFQRSVPSLTLRADFLRVGARGKELAINGSTYGTTPEDLAHTLAGPALLDALGVLAADDGSPYGSPLPFVRIAGDALADAPRTFGHALRGGIRAAQKLLNA